MYIFRGNASTLTVTRTQWDADTNYCKLNAYEHPFMKIKSSMPYLQRYTLAEIYYQIIIGREKPDGTYPCGMSELICNNAPSCTNSLSWHRLKIKWTNENKFDIIFIFFYFLISMVDEAAAVCKFSFFLFYLIFFFIYIDIF